MNQKRDTFSSIVDAYNILFGNKNVSLEVIKRIELTELKTIYRHAAKIYHPDVPNGCALHFRKITESYSLLFNFLSSNKKTIPDQKVTTFDLNKKYPIKTKDLKGTYYKGKIPDIPFKIGLFLYYSGKIPYESLVKALVWQRNMRPPLGELAIQWKWLNQYFVSVILCAVNYGSLFGERAVNLGLLSESQLNVLLRQQSFMQKPLGIYFIKEEVLSASDIADSLHNMSLHNKMIHERRKTRTFSSLFNKKEDNSFEELYVF